MRNRARDFYREAERARDHRCPSREGFRTVWPIESGVDFDRRKHLRITREVSWAGWKSMLLRTGNTPSGRAEVSLVAHDAIFTSLVVLLETSVKTWAFLQETGWRVVGNFLVESLSAGREQDTRQGRDPQSGSRTPAREVCIDTPFYTDRIAGSSRGLKVTPQRNRVRAGPTVEQTGIRLDSRTARELNEWLTRTSCRDHY